MISAPWNACFLGKLGLLFVCALTALALDAHAGPDSKARAKKLFSRLTGTAVSSRDPRVGLMAKLLDQGEGLKAAQIAMNDEDFYGVTVKHWASLMSNRQESPYVPLDDFQALVIGLVRDELDARLLLTGDFSYIRGGGYVRNSADFDYIIFDRASASYKKDLIRVPQTLPQDDEKALQPAGLLTTHAWAKAHYSGGTNRRAVQFAFQEFLCIPIESWKTPALDDQFVRKDVDRKPGDNPDVFRTQCRNCHAPMDAMAGAFANVNFDPELDLFDYTSGVHEKYSQNTTVSPGGNETLDASWVNLLAANHIQDEYFGWGAAPIQGEGIQEFGQMLSQSKAFRTCMVKRVFKELCKRDPMAEDQSAILTIGQDFASRGHNLKNVFAEVALLPACLGDGAQ